MSGNEYKNVFVVLSVVQHSELNSSPKNYVYLEPQNVQTLFGIRVFADIIKVESGDEIIPNQCGLDIKTEKEKTQGSAEKGM